MSKQHLWMGAFFMAALLLASCQPAASSESASLSSSREESVSSSSSVVPTILNKDKPLAFYGRQPLASSGEADTATLNFNSKTFYVGMDYAGEGSLQGELITEYFATKKIADVDVNGDGYFGYALFVGDDGNVLARNRTLGIRLALGTVTLTMPHNAISGASNTMEGTLTLKDGGLKVKEIVSEPMFESTTGAYWSADAARDKTSSWVGTYGKAIDAFISNDDGMALGALSSPAYPAPRPIFGFGGEAAALAKIQSGQMAGTILRPLDDIAAGTLEVLRSGFDGLSTGDIAQKGFSLADAYGNEISNNFSYVPASRSLLFSGTKVTSANAASFAKSTRDPHFSHPATGAKKISLWIDCYDSSDRDWTDTYHDALVYYADLLAIEPHFFYGDGASESTLTDQFTALGSYDAYAVNLIKPTNGSLYTQGLLA